MGVTCGYEVAVVPAAKGVCLYLASPFDRALEAEEA